MKKIVHACVIFLFCTQYAQATKISLMNMMSQQATVSIDTEKKSYSMQVNPSENVNLQKNLDHGINQYDNSSSFIDIDNSPIKKITIKRMQSDIPQIIYYNSDVIAEKDAKPSGVYGVSLSGIGSMKIVQDSITLNNQTYNINDLHSFKIKCEKLKEMLASKKDLKNLEQEINDLSQSLRLFEGSGMASSLSLQLAVIRSEVDYIVNKLQILHQVKDYVHSLQDITKTLTADNVDAVENKLNNMITGLQTLDQPDTKNIIDIEKIKKDMTDLQSKIATIKHNLHATDRKILVDQ